MFSEGHFYGYLQLMNMLERKMIEAPGRIWDPDSPGLTFGFSGGVQAFTAAICLLNMLYVVVVVVNAY